MGLAAFLFKTLLVQTTQVKNFRKVNTTLVLFFVSFLSNCAQDCMHWANMGYRKYSAILYCKELTYIPSVTYNPYFSPNTRPDSLDFDVVSISLTFLFSSLKSTKLQKNEKKLDKNVIAKLSGNKVVLLRR